jgi:6-pyruvoyltetrahydropterin/6-carboxytetrahydropterin synthase
MIYVTRKEHFNAAHKIYRPDWTEEQNLEVFGKCCNANWHGHNYTLFVTVKGEPSPETGFVVDLLKLGKLIRELVIEELDHKNLNLDVPMLQGIMPSTENIAIAIWNRLDAPIKQMGATLHCVKLYETENNFVEYYG